MDWRQTITSFIKNETCQEQCWSSPLLSSAAIWQVSELGLNLVPKVPGQERFVLAGIKSALVGDFPDVGPVLEQRMQVAA